MTRRRGLPSLLLSCVAITCTVVACSSGGGTSNGAASKTAPATSSAAAAAGSLKSELPAQFQQGIQVGLTNDTPPLIFKDSSGKDVGMDLELLKSVSKVLGVPLTPHSVPFADMLLGLQSGKYAFVTDTTINAAREKIFDQVSNFQNSSSFGSLKSMPAVGSSYTAVCGQTVGVVTGNNTVAAITDTINPACKSAGKSPVIMKEYPDFNTVYVNMQSGNLKMCFVDTGSYGYFLSQPAGANFKLNGPANVLKSYNGYSTLKANVALAKVLQKAIQETMDNGQYAAILKKWGMSGVEVKTSTINPPVTS